MDSKTSSSSAPNASIIPSQPATNQVVGHLTCLVGLSFAVCLTSMLIFCVVVSLLLADQAKPNSTAAREDIYFVPSNDPAEIALWPLEPCIPIWIIKVDVACQPISIFGTASSSSTGGWNGWVSRSPANESLARMYVLYDCRRCDSKIVHGWRVALTECFSSP